MWYHESVNEGNLNLLCASSYSKLWEACTEDCLCSNWFLWTVCSCILSIRSVKSFQLSFLCGVWLACLILITQLPSEIKMVSLIQVVFHVWKPGKNLFSWLIKGSYEHIGTNFLSDTNYWEKWTCWMKSSLLAADIFLSNRCHSKLLKKSQANCTPRSQYTQNNFRSIVCNSTDL